MAEKKVSTTEKKVAAPKKAAAKTTEKKTATVKKATAKSDIVYINAENAGFRAGDVYQVLAAAEAPLTLAEVAKAAKVSESDALLGLGWLLKEGKVSSDADNKIVLA